MQAGIGEGRGGKKGISVIRAGKGKECRASGIVVGKLLESRCSLELDSSGRFDNMYLYLRLSVNYRCMSNSSLNA